jgi:hypothetical protein
MFAPGLGGGGVSDDKSIRHYLKANFTECNSPNKQ